jgi:hypothetical protein
LGRSLLPQYKFCMYLWQWHHIVTSILLRGKAAQPSHWKFENFSYPKNILKLISLLYMAIGISIYSKEISFSIFLSVAEILNFPVWPVYVACVHNANIP